MLQSWLNRVWRSMVFARLQRWHTGRLTIADGGESFDFGDAGGESRATIRVHDPGFYARVACGGGLGAAESYLDGDWTCDDLCGLIRLCIRNPEVATGLDGGVAVVARLATKWQAWMRRNTRTGARKNIHAHYDLGNDFFRLFLDETLSYSCGVFHGPNTDLRNASLAKIERVCRKLELDSDDEVLEIGTGWGALSAHMAERFGCRVRTATISREQAVFARERMLERGLQHLVSVDLEDYRDLRGEYDRLVSIEMIEAVGREYLDDYFRQCSRLLRPDGLMVLQGIVMRDQLAARHESGVDFIGKYIFPGGYLPSVTSIAETVARVTDLRIIDLEELSPHYVRTLQEWRERFWREIESVRRLGFDDRFVRMWDYYLQYCEAAFAERQVNVVQIVLAKPRYRLSTEAPSSAAPPMVAPLREELIR